MIYFLTIFKTTSNDSKLAVTHKLGKSCLWCDENLPLNYRQLCLQAYNAMLQIPYMCSKL